MKYNVPNHFQCIGTIDMHAGGGRSATGSRVSACAALHYAKGEMKPGDIFTIESILDTTMDVEIAEVTTFGPYDAVVPKVSGSAWFTGKDEFWFDRKIH